ncbi:hypothetical protein K4F52_002952 [Lecanicillium sp. MT-2017a]|nr:hypothetical protein K4F52_002952 [Lecanicillium sp. MT-2017a]
MSSPKDDAAQPVGDDAPRDETVASPVAEPETRSKTSDLEDGEVDADEAPAAPPLPNEATPDCPPLPSEPVPQAAAAPVEDDGWDCQWDGNSQSWFFYNRFTGKTQWDNPRVPAAPSAPGVAPGASASATSSLPPGPPPPPAHEKPAAGGYNPAIHGDYDPNAWYAQGGQDEDGDEGAAVAAAGAVPGDVYGTTTVAFNRYTGAFQTEDEGPGRHTDEAKSRRQMNAYFDVDSAANSHDGRSLKAERTGKKPSKSEVKAFKEKRRARKEEKRRAWLRD